jgi:type 1 glutamine amidotransferase
MAGSLHGNFSVKILLVSSVLLCQYHSITPIRRHFTHGFATLKKGGYRMFRNFGRSLGLALLGLAGLLVGTMVQAGGQNKVRVLIIDGQNNHNWKATTPVMKKALEATGRFTVDVATTPTQPQNPQKPKEPQKPQEPQQPKAPAKPKDPDDAAQVKKYEEAKKNYDKQMAKYETDKKNFDKNVDKLMAKYEADKKDFDANKDKLMAKYEAAKAEYEKQVPLYKEGMAKFHPDLTKYDVVLSNYNGDSWSKDFQEDLEKTLKAGKIGLVIVHAANNSFGNWVEYNLMIGMGWRGEQYGKRLKVDENGKVIIVPKGQDQGSGHRYSGPFQITIRDDDHPITKGMPAEWMHFNDELYDNMRGPIENVHLLATAYSKGTNTNEPMIWTVSYGKGRVFHTPMGHDVGSMTCIGFQTTLARGTEWAATGKVTIPIPQNFPTATKTSTIKQ